MRASLTDLLVGEGASQHLAEHGGVAEGLQGFVQAVHQRVEKLERVVLLPQVHRLTPQPEAAREIIKSASVDKKTEAQLTTAMTFFFLPELFPETPRDVVLQPGCRQVAEDDLQVAQHPDVVLLPVLRLAGGLVVKLVMVAEDLVAGIDVALQERAKHKQTASAVVRFFCFCFF